ncbi:trypsin-like peptidase domain-containing protein [Streptomyces sp. P9(2023)]|uniref:S1C family serine protease n=1 Tax=Streptomyces sp. P9(2023) TaxID=3064394 RepID=UPI0028F427AC|nr:trypsin-like peptidase domain-containing protein [Streptomyces sp. P9(2023)]MDT9693496.1 trypsin-like peptidase domain-containing protein [Streptomyces sp. P9(2023)]
MSTENEGTEVPADPSAPSAPPAPPTPPTPPAPAAPPAPEVPPTPTPHAASVDGSEQAASTAGGWPPPPPAVPAWGAPVPPVPAAPRKRTGGLVAAVLVAALVAGGVGGGIGYWAAERGDDGISSTTVAAGDSPVSFKRDPGTVAAVASKALPSVVTIQAKSGGTGGQSEGDGGTGTGFVYDREGHIVTNNHVVASAADGGTLSATFSNGKTYDAEVVGRAEGYDVAVLKLKKAPDGLAPLPLGDSEKVAVGDSTIAIGAPFGLSNTVTTGIISAKNRPVASGDGSGGKNSYMSALQTDASINPGNSGGPLLDASGAVIGINSAIQSAGSGFGQTQAGSIGLGFAIPVNQAKNVAEQLIKTGKPVYPVIGATVNMTDKGAGATIADAGAGGTPAVTPDGPAAKAGLKPGDVITALGDRQIDSGPTLISEIWTHKSGDSIKLTYERDGKPATTTVTLGERTGDN